MHNNKKKYSRETRNDNEKTATKTTIISTTTKATYNAPKRKKTKGFRKTRIQKKPKWNVPSKVESIRTAAINTPHGETTEQALIRISKEGIIKSPTIEVSTLTSGSTQNSPPKVNTSDNKNNFMVTSPNSPHIPTTFSSKISPPKIDKAVKKIQQLNATPKTSNSPIGTMQYHMELRKPRKHHP